MPKHLTSSRRIGSMTRDSVEPHFREKYCIEKYVVSSVACSGSLNWLPAKALRLLFKHPAPAIVARNPTAEIVLSDYTIL